MWFIFALLTTLSWGCADLFYKKGNTEGDKYSHLKTVIMVGLVMGIHGFFYMTVNNIDFSPKYLITYLPVSAMYILSMAIGYAGLRYIELSISSPIQNSSGAVTSILIFIFFTHTISVLEGLGIVIITVGITILAILEKNKAKEEEILSLEEDKRYRKSFLAIIFPILYCIIDGLGTFADAIYLDELSLISEEHALLAYEFTFLICGIIAFIYLKYKKESFNILREKDMGIAAIFETIGQFFYVFSISDKAIIAAPLIASYSIVSVILSRIVLKEKLTRQQYATVMLVMIGIALLGLAEGLAG
ncbi:EamA family transporter [Alloiococcus sp. CFN-8]|uniref:EamA family transporter n=1 Tax=Alloiococcus sp. CFN-8 TaxID=3416081 RepID=UPI003CE9E0DB